MQLSTLLKAKFEQIDFIVGCHTMKKSMEIILLCNIVMRKTLKLLLLGHMDTVFPEGTAKKRPFIIEGERAFGPGVIDMKASLVSLLYALTVLKQAGKKGYQNVQIILNSDEETWFAIIKSADHEACDE